METKTTTFFDLIAPDLVEVEARMRINPYEHHPSLVAAIEHLLSSGGKRIRPSLVLLTGGMLGAKRDDAITLAAAIEMLHTATLVHDDLIDDSLLRRGIPTLNAQWSPGATVLTGDYIFARAAYLASAISEQDLMEIFARTLMTIVNGEIAQLFNSSGIDDEEDYFARIYAKTASLFEAATEGSAIISNCTADIVASMKQFGFNIGMAFQIIDDVLDFVADQEQIGKPVAHDLRQGLITLPTLAYIKSNPQDSQILKQLHEGRLDERELEHLIVAIRNSSAVEEATQKANEFIAIGEEQLSEIPASPEREALFELAQYISNRTI
jgi:geranylgeranyl pyrophosphate synthase